LEIFFLCKRFEMITTVRIHLPKIFLFFFHMLFWWSSEPSFGWYKVTKNSNKATTSKIRQPGSPKLGTSLIIMSPLGSPKLHT
jgi:hypothetical protein